MAKMRLRQMKPSIPFCCRRSPPRLARRWRISDGLPAGNSGKKRSSTLPKGVCRDLQRPGPDGRRDHASQPDDCPRGTAGASSGRTGLVSIILRCRGEEALRAGPGARGAEQADADFLEVSGDILGRRRGRQAGRPAFRSGGFRTGGERLAAPSSNASTAACRGYACGSRSAWRWPARDIGANFANC